MHPTRKDLGATILAVGVTLIALAVLGEWGWPLLGSVRIGAVAVLVLSMGMCATGNVSSGDVSMRDPYVRFMAGFGVVILAAGAVAIITASELWLAIETTLVVAMWAISTGRHAFVTERHVTTTH